MKIELEGLVGGGCESSRLSGRGGGVPELDLWLNICVLFISILDLYLK